MEFGVAHSTRNKTYHIDQSFLTLGGGTLSGGNAVTTAPIPSGTCDPLSFMGIGSQPCYNPFDLISNGTLQQVPTFGSSLSLPPDWKVRENTLTPYLQFNMDTYVGGVSLRGNFGVQANRTQQRGVGERVAPGHVALYLQVDDGVGLACCCFP